jgi:hypothetical protein
MSGEEFIVVIISVVSGTAFLGYTVAKITGLFNKWMDQRHERKTGGSEMQQLVSEYEQFRTKTEKRLRNLEAIVSQDEPEQEQLEEPSIDMTQEIEFPSEEDRSETAPSRQQSDSPNDNRLNNMLD